MKNDKISKKLVVTLSCIIAFLAVSFTVTMLLCILIV